LFLHHAQSISEGGGVHTISVGRRRAPAVLGSGSGSGEGRGIRAQGDYRTGERL